MQMLLLFFAPPLLNVTGHVQGIRGLEGPSVSLSDGTCPQCLSSPIWPVSFLRQE